MDNLLTVRNMAAAIKADLDHPLVFANEHKGYSVSYARDETNALVTVDLHNGRQLVITIGLHE